VPPGALENARGCEYEAARYDLLYFVVHLFCLAGVAAMIAAEPVAGSLSEAALLGLLFFSCVEKAVDRLHHGTTEGAQRCKRHIDKLMSAASFHQLGNASAFIDMHDDK
jgi:hypothetical protein